MAEGNNIKQEVLFEQIPRQFIQPAVMAKGNNIKQNVLCTCVNKSKIESNIKMPK